MLSARRMHKQGRYDIYTKSMLHFDGADASTTFTDESGLTWTASGNTQIDTAQSVFGGASLLLDGAGDYLTAPSSANLNVGTGSFTIDFRIRPNGTPNLWTLFKKPTTALTSNGIGTDATAHINWWKDGTNAILTSTTALASGNWYHIAFVRDGTSFKLYVNGSNQATVVNSDSFDFSGFAIGKGYYDNQWNGWVDEFRISNVARWTSDFTPPAAAYS